MTLLMGTKKVAKSDSVRLIHFFILDIFFEFFDYFFVFVFFDFSLSPAPPSVGLIKRTFRGGLRGSGGV